MRTRLGGWVERRPTAVAAALFFVISLAFFAPGLAPGRTLSASDFLWTATPWDSIRPAEVPGLGSNRELLDSVTQFQPDLQYTRASLPDIPVWDPYVLGGRPYAADPQAQVFSVFSVPSYVLPFWKSLAVSAILKVFLSALGAFLLARVLGMGLGGALVTGLAFGFSLWSVSWVSWGLGSVSVSLPWICLFCEACVRRPGPLPWAGLAVATGVGWLGGHPSSSFQILVVVSLFFLGRTLASRKLRERLVPRLLTLASGVLAGCALAAVMLIPFAELLGQSGDAGARAEISKALFHQEPARLLGLFLHDWWGSGRTSIEFGATTQEHYYYVGALPLMLAAIAVLTRVRLERIAVALVGAFSIAVATGVSPVFDLVVSLPGFEAANNSRFAIFTVLALAVLAGWGMDELTDAVSAVKRRRATLAVASGLLVLPLLVALAGGHVNLDVAGRALRSAWLFAEPSAALLGTPAGPEVVRLGSLFEWLLPAAAAVMLLALRLSGRLSVPAFTALAVTLVALDLLRAGAGYNPVIKQEHAEQPATAAVRYLRARAPERFAGLENTAPASLSPPLPPNLALRYRVLDARGNVIPSEERYVELWRRLIARDKSCYSFFCTVAAVPTPESFRALGLVGVGYLLQSQRDEPLPGLRTVYTGPDARIYRNPGVLPRAFLVDRQQVVPDPGAQLLTVASESFDARALAVTESRLPGLGEGAGGAAAAAGRARITSYEDDEVSVRTSSARASLLVLTDSWYPGWKASVDGKDVEVQRVNYLVRGVAVPAGAHRVELRYEPASWRAGWIVSLVALLVVAGVALLGWRRRRRPMERSGARAGMFKT